MLKKIIEEIVKSKKQYKITVKSDVSLRYFLKELDQWKVKPSAYKVDKESMSVITADKNVVDVATESFINHPEMVTIEKI